MRGCGKGRRIGREREGKRERGKEETEGNEKGV